MSCRLSASFNWKVVESREGSRVGSGRERRGVESGKWSKMEMVTGEGWRVMERGREWRGVESGKWKRDEGGRDSRVERGREWREVESGERSRGVESGERSRVARGREWRVGENWEWRLADSGWEWRGVVSVWRGEGVRGVSAWRNEGREGHPPTPHTHTAQGWPTASGSRMFRSWWILPGPSLKTMKGVGRG